MRIPVTSSVMQSVMTLHAAHMLEKNYSIGLGLVDGRLYLPACKMHPVQANATGIVYHMQDAYAYALCTGVTPVERAVSGCATLCQPESHSFANPCIESTAVVSLRQTCTFCLLESDGMLGLLALLASVLPNVVVPRRTTTKCHQNGSYEEQWLQQNCTCMAGHQQH